MSDEIYDDIIYDDAHVRAAGAARGRRAVPDASAACRKVHRACGWRVGWAVLSGRRAAPGDLPPRDRPARRAAPVRERARASGPIAPALQGADTITPLCAPGGRLYESRRAVDRSLRASEHLSLVPPRGRAVRLPVASSASRADSTTTRSRWNCSRREDVLVVPGSSFNVPLPQPLPRHAAARSGALMREGVRAHRRAAGAGWRREG